MTTIIAVENADNVLIGSDSQVTAGNQKASLQHGKIITNGEYTIGVAGAFRFLQLLEHMDLPTPDSGSLERHMSTVFGPAVEAFAEQRAPGAFEHSLALIVVRRQVFALFGDGSVLRNQRGHYAIGSGSGYALGALNQVKGEATPKDMISALEAAAQYDTGTSGPFWVRKV